MVTGQNDLVYILHTRAYGETSQLVDLLSGETGRLRVVARSSRKPRRSGAGPLQAFVPLLASWRGRGDLKTLTNYEPVSHTPPLQGDALYIGLYVNELLCRLLPDFIPLPELFFQYQSLLELLGQNEDMEPALRTFEMLLLDEMGYGLNLQTDVSGSEPIRADRHYRYCPGEGFLALEAVVGKRTDIYTGVQLQAIADHRFDQAEIRQCAKRLLRGILAEHLGNRPLHSRELFKQRRRGRDLA